MKNKEKTEPVAKAQKVTLTLDVGFAVRMLKRIQATDPTGFYDGDNIQDAAQQLQAQLKVTQKGK
jgi:uncharacterized protein YaiI (UPF0178 family)